MSEDAARVVVGANGQVAVAPTDAVMPTDATSALSGDWVEVGFTSEAGVTLEDTKTMTDIMAWQAFGPIRKIVADRMFKLTTILREWGTANVELAFGGGSVASSNINGVSRVLAVTLSGFGGTEHFHLTWNAAESAVITRGTNFTAAGIKAAIEGITGFASANPEGVTVSDVSDEGFLITYNGFEDDEFAFTVTTSTADGGLVAELVDGVPAVAGGSTYTPPSPEDVDERAMCVTWQDGSKNYRVLVPLGIVTDTVSTNLTRTAAADLPLGFEALANGTDPYWTLFTDDPAFTAD